jgi:mRNA-degrading endonuclease RelE of RelBE toxin-antitoxin system
VTEGRPYHVEVAGSARRDLRRLPIKIAAAVIEFISGPLAENPQRLSKHLHGELAAYRSARRGDYRVLFRIDDDKHAIVVVAINHRAHIYRPRGAT